MWARGLYIHPVNRLDSRLGSATPWMELGQASTHLCAGATGAAWGVAGSLHLGVMRVLCMVLDSGSRSFWSSMDDLLLRQNHRGCSAALEWGSASPELAAFPAPSPGALFLAPGVLILRKPLFFLLLPCTFPALLALLSAPPSARMVMHEDKGL